MGSVANSKVAPPSGSIDLPCATGHKGSAFRILVIDDHPIFVHGLSALINAESRLEVCGTAHDKQTAVEVMRETQPHAATVDLSLPGGSGIDLIAMLKSERPDLVILAVSMYDDTPSVLRALEAGACGYCVKGEDSSDLLSGIHGVLNGEKYLTPKLRERIVLQAILDANAPIHSAIERLTDREAELLRLIGSGLGSSEIAAQLGISIKTVETHRGHIKEKLSLSEAKSLANFARDWVWRVGIVAT